MSTALSDYNRSGYTAKVVAGKVYHDLSYKFINDDSGDTLRATDLEAIRNSIKNIVLTPIGSRPFYPEFGTGVASLLFELADNITKTRIQEEIDTAIRKWEPRILNPKITVIDQSEVNAYHITIEFTAVYGGLATIEFILNRIR